MAEGGFFETRQRISPTGLTVVVLLHGAAITALALSKMEMPEMIQYLPIEIEAIEVPPDPAPIPPEPVRDQQPVPRDSQIDVVPPRVPTVPQGPAVTHDPTPDIPVFDVRPLPKVDLPPADPAPPAPPVRVAAQMRGSDLQPPYPPAEERLGREGNVAIRVTIGTNGRVIGAEKVSATSEAFYRATERHALRAWRFRPATVDGKPVESRQVINVEFLLNG